MQIAENNHLMVDLETLSTEDNAVITHYSVIQFCPITGEVFDVLNSDIGIQSCLDLGLEVSESTLKFWFEQSKEAQEKSLNFDNPKSVELAFSALYQFIKSMGEGVKLWGKGPTFDITKLSTVFKKLGYKELPWKFYNERCVRTALMDKQEEKYIDFEGVKHNAEDDCRHQIKQLKIALSKNYN